MCFLLSLVMADYTAVAVLVSVGALIGKTTLTQLVVLALIEVVIQVFNEYINVQLIYVRNTLNLYSQTGFQHVAI